MNVLLGHPESLMANSVRDSRTCINDLSRHVIVFYLTLLLDLYIRIVYHFGIYRFCFLFLYSFVASCFCICYRFWSIASSKHVLHMTLLLALSEHSQQVLLFGPAIVFDLLFLIGWELANLSSLLPLAGSVIFLCVIDRSGVSHLTIRYPNTLCLDYQFRK